VALGLLTRLTCLALAVFSVVANVVFNAGSTDQVVQYLFAAELAVVGGFLAFMAVGAGGWSIDALIKRRTSA
jgi:putative oxidoreductase